MEMVSNRPYLLRAFYDWIVDSQCTPVLVADPKHPRCKVPFEYEQDGEVVFNISPTAVRDLDITNDVVQFRASFNGIVHLTLIPIGAVLALYADENNEGIFFDSAEEELTAGIDPSTNYTLSPVSKDYQEDLVISPSSSDRSPNAVKGKPVLRLVEID